MSLAMQGRWSVAVKSRSAAFAQRLVITGASTGAGTHAATPGMAPILVDGANWSIRVEAQHPTGWRPSAMRFKTPQQVGAEVLLDIESDDGGGSDQDFNDLILTCRMTAGTGETVLHGHASAYSGRCLFNPCYRFGLLLDSPFQLETALKNPLLRDVLTRLYPERIVPGPKNPGDPAPDATFVPLMLPSARMPSLPPVALQRTTTLRTAAIADAPASVVRSVSLRETPPPVLDLASVARIGTLAEGLSRLPYFCSHVPLVNYGLRFQEYDRNASELTGGPYTGTGDRETLGQTATDAFGNYVFRFSRGLSDIVAETLGDVAAGEDATVQVLPDVIAQVLGAGLVSAAETGCHFNVPGLYRLDLCVPQSQLVLPEGCADNRVFTMVGKISMTSSLNTLDADGRITARSTAGNAPVIDCAVWSGHLDLWGCLGTAVAHYTLRWRDVSGPVAGDWQTHGALETREVADGSSKKIGPFFAPPLAVPFDGAFGKVPTACYRNAEVDPDVVQPGTFLKATLPSGGFPPGSYEVRIDGYDADGDLLRSDTLTLRIDNRVPFMDVAAITLAGQPVEVTGSGCTLQALTPAQMRAPLTVRFKVEHGGGAMLNYGLSVGRCNESAGFAVTPSGGGAPSFQWVHDATVDCGTFPNFRLGTAEDPDNDGSGYVTAVLTPVADWLDAGQNFTILKVGLSGAWRATNGYANASPINPVLKVWGIQR